MEALAHDAIGAGMVAIFASAAASLSAFVVAFLAAFFSAIPVIYLLSLSVGVACSLRSRWRSRAST
jgi:hypothetical protein